MTSDPVYSLDAFIDAVHGYIEDPHTIQTIQQAYQYAKAHHEGQTRASGEPYISHPLAVAFTLSEYKTDPTTLIAGLLHDVLEDTQATFDEIKAEFGLPVATLIEGVTKLGQFKYKGAINEEEAKLKAQAQNYQKMLMAMAKDIRVIVVKLADRLHNMRTLDFMDQAKQHRIAKETLDIYAPLAHRFGMYVMKAELEDTAFKYLEPTDYRRIAQLIIDTKNDREKDLSMMRTNLEYLLRENKFAYDVKGRVKNIYSVYKKMASRKKEFEEIYDLLALRVVVSSIESCYSAIGVIHSKWTPIPNRFKDYIAMPKPNLYQSLHTSIIANGKIYEIQIRTQEMDDIAEYGIAAHWSYKENRDQAMTETVTQKLKWYSDLVQFTEDNQSGADVLDLLKEDIFHSNVYVFTPDGDIIDLPKGAMPLDFAFRIHTEVGLKSVGAIVNNKIVPLDYQLQTGDIVKMKTSKQSFGPNDNWLKLVKTSNAKSKIKNYLNKQRRDELVDIGKNDLLKELSKRHYTQTFSDKEVAALFSKKGVHSLDDLYFEIGKNTIKPVNAANSLIGAEEYTDQDLMNQINKQAEKNAAINSEIVVEGLDNPSIKLANCCSPVPGDKIVGYVSKGVGIAVHRTLCNNVKNFDPDRLIPVFWGQTKQASYSVNLRLMVSNRDNILAEIVNTITASKGKVNQVLASTNARGEAVMKLKVGIATKEELDTVIQNLNKVKDIYSIERPMK